VENVRKAACEALLEQRTEAKLKSSRIQDIMNRLQVAEPTARDEKERLPSVPESVIHGAKDIAQQRQSEWEQQQSLYLSMDPNHTGIDHRDRYIMDDPEWRYDVIPEVMDGKNIADFYSSSLPALMEKLEREELIRDRKERKEREEEDDDQYRLTDEQQDKVKRIRTKKALLILENKTRSKSTPLSRTTRARSKSVDDFEKHLNDLGYDSSLAVESARSRSVERSSTPSRSVSTSRTGREVRKRKREDYERSMTPKPGEGYRNVKQKIEAQKLARGSIKKFVQDGRAAESDRHVYDWKPKHLSSGKASFSRDRR